MPGGPFILSVMKNTKHRHLIIVLTVMLLALIVIACCVGRYTVNPKDMLHAIQTKMTGEPGNLAMENVFFIIRLPRVIAAVSIGAVLSLCGAVYQGIFKNPLVSPDLLGVSKGACVGAALAILLGGGMLARQLSAFAFGIIAMLMTMTFPKLLRNQSNLVLVLAGIITSGFMDSILGLMKFTSENDTDLTAIVFWQMGSLASIKVHEILSVLPVFAVGALILLSLSFRINILSFGDIEAQSLGVNVKKIRWLIILIASLLTASAVCISGTIAWIGLIMPHLARMLAGSDHIKSLPVTMLVGGIFLLLIDTIARTATSLEIPLSVLTGLIGAPFFAWLLYRQKAKVS